MTTPPGPTDPAAPQPGAATPPLLIHGQYVKDLSFENPRAPQSLIEQKQPQLNLNVTVNNRPFDPKTFEISLKVEASAHTAEKEPLFLLELEYAGTVSLGAVPPEHVGPLLYIETPRLLFPFARTIIANLTREAGFPPLNIAPVDFVALYRQMMEQNGGKLPGLPGTPGSPPAPTGPVGHA